MKVDLREAAGLLADARALATELEGFGPLSSELRGMQVELVDRFAAADLEPVLP
jgi:hypothetical protein